MVANTQEYRAKKKINVGMAISTELHEKLTILSAAREQTMSAVMREMVSRCVAKEFDQESGQREQ